MSVSSVIEGDAIMNTILKQKIVDQDETIKNQEQTIQKQEQKIVNQNSRNLTNFWFLLISIVFTIILNLWCYKITRYLDETTLFISKTKFEEIQSIKTLVQYVALFSNTALLLSPFLLLSIDNTGGTYFSRGSVKNTVVSVVCVLISFCYFALCYLMGAIWFNLNYEKGSSLYVLQSMFTIFTVIMSVLIVFFFLLDTKKFVQNTGILILVLLFGLFLWTAIIPTTSNQINV